MVIIQPTPEIESKPSLGEQEEEHNQADEQSEGVEDDQMTTVEVVVNPDFTLDKPTPKPSEGLFLKIASKNRKNKVRFFS